MKSAISGARIDLSYSSFLSSWIVLRPDQVVKPRSQIKLAACTVSPFPNGIPIYGNGIHRYHIRMIKRLVDLHTPEPNQNDWIGKTFLHSNPKISEITQPQQLWAAAQPPAWMQVRHQVGWGYVFCSFTCRISWADVALLQTRLVWFNFQLRQIMVFQRFSGCSCRGESDRNRSWLWEATSKALPVSSRNTLHSALNCGLRFQRWGGNNDAVPAGNGKEAQWT